MCTVYMPGATLENLAWSLQDPSCSAKEWSVLWVFHAGFFELGILDAVWHEQGRQVCGCMSLFEVALKARDIFSARGLPHKLALVVE